MKKYLQACELGGSIYGRKRTAARSGRSSKSSTRKKTNLLNDYDNLYKNQFSLMSRIFRRAK
ncbi:MAG: hypothetical protein ABH844_07465 [Candidatus Omnitrophota bacterium]